MKALHRLQLHVFDRSNLSVSRPPNVTCRVFQALAVWTLIGAGMAIAAEVHLEQVAYVKAANAEARDQFGASVAASGPTVAVGAPRESSSATGINGNAADNSAFEAGAVYVLAREGGAWVQQAYLKASNSGRQDRFGSALSISGETLAIGAQRKSTNGSGLSGGPGAAYVFVRSDAAWTEQAFLQASNAGASDEFGAAVALDGDTLVVGAPGEDSNAIGVNGDGSNDGVPQAGAAYVFVREGGQWTQQAYLKASNTKRNQFGAGGAFGCSVAIAGDTIVVGAKEEASNATGVNGNQANSSLGAAGAAYVFVRQGTTWTQQAYLKASNTGITDQFGSAVGIAGDTVVVGAPGEASATTQIDGDQADNSAAAAGAAYVFVRLKGTWSQQAYLKASNSGRGDQFGGSVAVLGDSLLIGASSEAGDATGVNGNDANDNAVRAGAAYHFVRQNGVWTQQSYLKPSNTDAGDQFGTAVALTSGLMVIGAIGEASNATGIDGNEADDSAANAGAAYLFAEPGAPALPDLTALEFIRGALRFSLPVAAGQTIGVEYSETLPTGPWTDLGNLTVAEGVATFVESELGRLGKNAGFYRAILR